jgi:hypothetical protein
MKYIFAIMVLSLFSFQNKPVEESVLFANTSFKLFTQSEEASYIKKMYLPKGQNSNDFYEKFSFYVIKDEKDVIKSSKERVKKLQERQKTDPKCNYEYILNHDNSGLVFQYFMSDDEKDFLEYNIEKHVLNTHGKYIDQISVYRYSYRAYAEDKVSFLKYLDDNKAQLIQDMWGFSL